MSSYILRADARHIPLADESVDLVVTSPPYLDTSSIQFLGSEVTRLEGFGNLSGPGGAAGTTTPDRQEGFRDQHFAWPQAHERNGAGALTDSLVNNVVGLPELTCCLCHRHHRFAGHDGWDRERLGSARRQTANLYGILGLEPLDPKVRQQGFANHPSLARRDRPMLQRLPAFGVRLGGGAVPIVEIKQQINSLRLDFKSTTTVSREEVTTWGRT